jgi:hypothetical protein
MTRARATRAAVQPTKADMEAASYLLRTCRKAARAKWRREMRQFSDGERRVMPSWGKIIDEYEIAALATLYAALGAKPAARAAKRKE